MSGFLQTDLFVKPVPAATLTKTMRPYQRQAIDGIETQLALHPSTLLVMATGLGKTVVAAHAVKGRTLFLAHLDTLVTQSLDELQMMTGSPWEREQGPERATRNGTRNVVASAATLKDPARFTSFPPNAFERVIVDEAHHYLGDAFMAPIVYFRDGGAKVIGLTATPDRKDGRAMGRLFASSAVDPPLDIGFGVDEAWLSPIEWRPIETDVDLDVIPVTRGTGDLDQSLLDEEIARVIAPIIKVAREKVGDKRTIIFTPGVKAAHAAAKALNDETPGVAFAVDGKMEREEKRDTISRHKAGEFQFLINCGVLVEGYDDARVICMIDAAPTMSRSRCAQKVGRITRPWPGTATSMDLAERRAAIAASPKPFAIWLDLAFNGHKHELASPVSLLGGSYTVQERTKAKKILEKEGGGDVKGALDKARSAIAAAANRARVRLQDKGAQDPLKKRKEQAEAPDPNGPPSPGLLRRCEELGIPTDGLTFAETNKILRKEFFAQKNGWCNYGERDNAMKMMGLNAWGMRKETMEKIKLHWRSLGRPERLTADQIATARGGHRG